MRRRHFETLRPRCPVCLARQADAPLEIASVVAEAGDDVLEGVLRCSRDACQREYPILDGIPLMVADLRAYVAAHIGQLTARDDLSEILESILGDCCGPGTPYDTARQQVGAYAWDHWGDLDPAEDRDPRTGGPRPGAARALLDRALDLGGELAPGPILDVGCAVGRTTLELAARRNALVLGADLHFAMLRTASEILRRGTVRYPRRRLGVVYETRRFAVDLKAAENVDFWACDATALPFADGTFAAVACLNVIDCLPSPAECLRQIGRVLTEGGKVLLASPYDWSPGATPIDAWLGGHSQRAAEGGASETILRRLLTPGDAAAVGTLEKIAEDPDLSWRVRMHERSTVDYRVDLVIARKRG